MSNSLEELYQEVVVDHSKNPRNFTTLNDAHYDAEGYNPLCGDRVHVYLVVEDEIIQRACFHGEGCAICTASASLMTEVIQGKAIKEVSSLSCLFRQVLTSDSQEDLGKLEVLRGVKKYPMRVKCATLAWHTLDAALRESSQVVMMN